MLLSDGVELFQGDIVMTTDIRNELRANGLYPFKSGNQGNSDSNKKPDGRQRRAVMSNKAKRWMGRNGKPVVPYQLESSVCE